MALSNQEAGRGHFTYEDLLHTPYDGQRYEVLEGDSVVSPSPTVKHQRIVHKLDLLLGCVEAVGLGVALPAPMDVILSAGDVVGPDLLFVASERLGIIAADNVQGAPDLAVEITSEGSRQRDVITNRHIYARYGVRRAPRSAGGS